MRYFSILLLIGLGIELMSLFMMIRWIGFGWTLLFIIAGIFAGSALMRHNAGITKVLMAGQFLRGGVSAYDMMLPIRIPLAGLLLALPTGFLSSISGILLLVPFKFFSQSSQKQSDIFSENIRQNGFEYANHSTNQDNVIEGDYVVRENKPNRHANDVIEHQP